MLNCIDGCLLRCFFVYGSILKPIARTMAIQVLVATRLIY
jgi:hypothetical protein